MSMHQRCLLLLLAAVGIYTEPLTTGVGRRQGGEGHTAGHFDGVHRATSTEPWSAQGAHDWHVLGYNRAAGEASGYNDKTGEIFHEVGPAQFGIGTACTECLLFDLRTCNVLTPAGIGQQPHAVVPYDRDHRHQLWKITRTEGVTTHDLPPGYMAGQPGHLSDQTWHIMSERDDTVEMTMFASLPMASMLQTSAARQLRCLAGWCLGRGSGEAAAFLATLMIVPLPRAFLDAEAEHHLHRSWPCDTLARAALVYVESRAASPDLTVRGGASTKSRAQVFAHSKRGAQLAALAAELLAPITGLATTYFKSAQGVLLDSDELAGGDDDLPDLYQRIHPIGLCDAPDDPVASIALETRGTSFTPEYINVTRPIRAIGHYCAALLGCVLQQVDWVIAFLDCIALSNTSTTLKADAYAIRGNARHALNLLNTVLGEGALQLAHTAGYTPILLADQVSISTEDAATPIFQLAKATSTLFADLLSKAPTNATADSRRTRTAQVACCYIKASEPERTCTLS